LASQYPAAKKSAHAKTLVATPMTRPLTMLFPPWRFGNNVKMANDACVESLSGGAVVAEWAFAALVVLGVIAEFAIAARHPAYDTWLGWWGPAYADLLVASGVVGEVLASMIAHLCQGELTRRSNVMLSEALRRASRAEEALMDFRKPRRAAMTPEATTALTARLKPFAGIHFDTGLELSNGEQADFLWDLAPALTNAGWVHEPWTTVNKFESVIRQGTRPDSGIVAASNVEIHLHPEMAATLMPATEALIAGLNDIGILARYWGGINVHNANPNAIHIAIGEKR
jgi:hypothetical protein